MTNRLLTSARVKQTGTIEDSLSKPLRASGETGTIEYVAGTGCQRRESFHDHTLPGLIERTINAGSSVAMINIGYEPSLPPAIQTQIAAEIAGVIRTSRTSARTYINVSPPDTRRTEELVGTALTDATTESVLGYIANILPKLKEVGNKYGVQVVVGAAVLHSLDNPFQGIGEECDLNTATHRCNYIRSQAKNLAVAAREQLQKSFHELLSGVEAVAKVERYAA